MNFDRNTVIGFVLLALLFFGYFYLLNTEQSEMRQRQAREQFVRDSLAAAQAPALDTQKLVLDSARAVALERKAQAGSFTPATDSNARIYTLENKQVKVQFTTSGGQIQQVELKGYLQLRRMGWVIRLRPGTIERPSPVPCILTTSIPVEPPMAFRSSVFDWQERTARPSSNTDSSCPPTDF
jgi:hypothetical protein